MNFPKKRTPLKKTLRPRLREFPGMSQRVEEFLNFLKTEKGASEHTTKNYGIDLREFMKFLGERDLTALTYGYPFLSGILKDARVQQKHDLAEACVPPVFFQVSGA